MAWGDGLAPGYDATLLVLSAEGILPFYIIYCSTVRAAHWKRGGKQRNMNYFSGLDSQFILVKWFPALMGRNRRPKHSEGRRHLGRHIFSILSYVFCFCELFLSLHPLEEARRRQAAQPPHALFFLSFPPT